MLGVVPVRIAIGLAAGALAILGAARDALRRELAFWRWRATETARVETRRKRTILAARHPTVWR